MSEDYKLIAKKMGVIWSEEIERILKALYSPEESEILLLFTGPYMDRLITATIAEKLKRPNEEIKPLLEEMARTQRLFSAKGEDKTTYSLFPLLPGLFELYFANHERAIAEE
ncbi:MAG: hypothetical protein ACFFG0_48950 [Candidatus Thorarchaeota archaeon]